MSNKESVKITITEKNNKAVTLQIMQMRVAGKTYKEIESEIGLSVDEMKKTTYNSIAFKIQPGILNETIKPEDLNTAEFWAKYGIDKEFGLELVTSIPMELKKAGKLSEILGRKTAVMKEITPKKVQKEKVEKTEVKSIHEQLATENAENLTKLLVDLMSDNQGDSAKMWSSRAISLMSGLMVALVELRDAGEILLDAALITDYLTIDKIIDLAKDARISEQARVALNKYLKSIPSFDISKGVNQSDTVKDQHGYLHMQFAMVLKRLESPSSKEQSKDKSDSVKGTEVKNQNEQAIPAHGSSAWMKDINGELHYVFKGPNGILSLNYGNIKSVLLGRNVADPENHKWVIQITTIAEKRSSPAGVIDVSDVYAITFDTFEEAFSFYPIHIPEGALVVKSEIGNKLFYTNVGEGMIATLNYGLIKSATVGQEGDNWMLRLTSQPELRVNEAGVIIAVSDVFHIGYNNKESAESAFPFAQ